MQPEIRESTRSDYPAIADVFRAADPDENWPRSAIDLQHHDQMRAPRFKIWRLVLEEDGRIVGTACCKHMLDLYHPRRLHVELAVRPERQSRGIGGQLYRAILDLARPLDPISLRAFCRENMPASLHFLRKRGFREDTRAWPSFCDLTGFDSSDLEMTRSRVRKAGIEIKTLPDLERDPDWKEKVCKLTNHVSRDMPFPERPTPVPLDQYESQVLQSPRLIPDLFFVAVDRDRFVGLSNLMSDPVRADLLHTGDTGVHRDYRRRGIALALKVLALETARARGARGIHTMNDTTNHAMLSINERLGFIRLPAWISFIRTFEAGT